MNKIIRILWKLFLFSFPFSLHFIFYDQFSYRFGNFNPWVTGFLFLPECLLFLLFFLCLVKHLKEKDSFDLKIPIFAPILFLLFIVNAGVVSYFQGVFIFYIYSLIRIFEFVLIYIFVNRKIIPSHSLIKWLLYGALFQIILSYIQLKLNHSLGLYFLGEPVIGPNIMNVAKTNIEMGIKVIRPYGTFLHSNILAVYLMTILFLSLSYLKKQAMIFWVILLSVGIYLTGSQSAQLGLFLTVVFFVFLRFLKTVFQKKVFSLAFIFSLFSANFWIYLHSTSLSWRIISIQERLMQNVISLNMFLENFFGVGVHNFTLKMELFSKIKLLPWEFQPVHNVYFLLLNETGLQGLLLILIFIFYFIFFYWKNFDYSFESDLKILPFIALLIVASFDHLLLTSFVGMVLLGFVISYIYPSKT